MHNCLSRSSSSCAKPVAQWSSLQVGKREAQGLGLLSSAQPQEGAERSACTQTTFRLSGGPHKVSFLWTASLLVSLQLPSLSSAPTYFSAIQRNPVNAQMSSCRASARTRLGFSLTTQTLSGVALASHTVYVSSGIKGLIVLAKQVALSELNEGYGDTGDWLQNILTWRP